MTEQEWLECADPLLMIEFVFNSNMLKERNFQLWGCGCCRRITQLMLDERCLNAVEAGERRADATISETSLRHIESDVNAAQDYAEARYSAAAVLGDEKARMVCRSLNFAANAAWLAITDHPDLPELAGLSEFDHPAAYFAALAVAPADNDEWARRAERANQAKLVRDIFKPFHPVTVDPTWRTSTVVSLAQAIYAERAFDHLPILADALEDAGCDNTDILNHCRQPGEHVRGCWVLDLLLAKE